MIYKITILTNYFKCFFKYSNIILNFLTLCFIKCNVLINHRINLLFHLRIQFSLIPSSISTEQKQEEYK